MEHKFILVLCISLLYKESLLNQNENSADLVTETLKGVTIPESKMTTSRLRETMIDCRKLILQMIKNGPGHKYSISVLRQKFNLLFNDDQKILDVLLRVIDDEVSEDTLANDISQHKKELMIFNAKRKFKELLAFHSRKCMYDLDSVDITKYASEIVEQLEPYTVGVGEIEDHPSIVDTIDFADVDALRELLTSAKKIDEGTDLIKCGWQELNGMVCGGFRPGESLLVNALEHNFKSGFCTAIFTHIPLFNIAPVREDKKKPLLLRISFENDTVTDIPWIYKYIKENVDGIEVNIKDIDENIAADYVSKFMTQNGWHFINTRIDPTNFTNKDIIDFLLSIIKKGYSITALLIDYLSMILPPDASSALYRDNFKKIRNFCSRRKIFFITPHQMSSEAKELTRGENPVPCLVKAVAGKQYYAGSKQLGHEACLELSIHIEKRKTPVGIRSYLDIHRGKHRGRTKIAPNDKLYTCIPFKDIGILPWDLDKENSSISKPGADYIKSVSDEFDWTS